MIPTIYELIEGLTAFDVHERISASTQLLERVEELKQSEDLIPIAVKSLAISVFDDTLNANYCLEILSSLGSLASESLPYLIESLRYTRGGFDTGKTQWLIINAIISIGEKALPDLVELVKWQIPNSSDNAISTLYKMGEMAQEARLELGLSPREEYIPPDIDLVKPSISLTLEEIKVMIKSDDPSTRFYAAKMLQDAEGSAEDKKFILSYLFSDEDVQVKGAALRSMTYGSVPLDFALPSILGLLNDDSNYVRWEAICAISNHFCKQAEPLMPKLRRMLFEDVPRVQTSILLAFTKMGSMAAPEAPLLIEILEMKRIGYANKMYACRALVAMGPSANSILEPLKQLFQNKLIDRDIRGWINKAIKAIETPNKKE